MAPTTACSKCSAPLASDAKFCGRCGAVVEDTSNKTLFEYAQPAPAAGAPGKEPVGSAPSLPYEPTAAAEAMPAPPAEPPAPAPAPAQPGGVKHTMLGFAGMDPSVLASARARVAAAQQAQGEAPPPSAANPPPPANPPPGMAKTMLGIPSTEVAARFGQPAAAPPAPAPAPAPAAPAQAAPPQPRVGATMLGVAIPGIAPTHAGEPANPPKGASGTMLGVAIPGIAPLRGGPGKTQLLQQAPRIVAPGEPIEPIVPAPAPFVDDEAPLAPLEKTAKSGVPLWIVAAGLAGTLLVVGIAVALLWKGAPPIVARPTLDPEGREALHLVCESCPDGTNVELGGSKTQLKANQADLVLPSPLVIGENPFELHVTRPGMGRDETVKLTVPVSFRIRADMSTLKQKPPAITVRVDALRDTEVSVDGKPLPLDAEGHASYAIDVSADAQGPSRVTKRIEKQIPYVVTQKGAAPSKGVLPAAVSIAPLQLDSPSSHQKTDQAQIVVAGQTLPGGSVKVNGETVPCDANGAFEKTLALGKGELGIDVEATGRDLGPRTVHAVAQRVDNLEAEAKAQETLPHQTYDAIKDAIATHAGQEVVLEGEIVESRIVGHQTILVLIDRRGCAAAKTDPNACLARVLFGGEDRRKKGDVVRVFGRVLRPVPAQNGREVPEVEADFLAKPRGR